MTEHTRASPGGPKAIVQVAAGNFLEMYDFMVFGYYAGPIAKAFFPSKSLAVSLLLALTTYGAGFLMRPVGAVALGAYADRRGRRASLLLSLSLMAAAALSLAITPPYAMIGVAAPLLVLAGRLVQGFSAGAELGGVSVYLSEIAPPGRRGLYVSWQSASQQVAVITAAVIGAGLSARLGANQMAAYGWRLPLLFGCLLTPVLFLLRRSLAETAAFASQPRPASLRQTLSALGRAWPTVGLGAMLTTTTTVAFYAITAYAPTFGAVVLKLSSLRAFEATFCVGVSNLVLLPVMGALSDRVGRRPLLIAAASLMIASAYPAMRWLALAPSFERLLAVELWLAFLYASYNGAMVALLTEIAPPQIKASAFSLAYSLATALFGGFTPAISQALVNASGDRAAPGLWVAAAAALGLTAAIIVPPAEAKLAGPGASAHVAGVDVAGEPD
jgi:MFS family permease